MLAHVSWDGCNTSREDFHLTRSSHPTPTSKKVSGTSFFDATCCHWGGPCVFGNSFLSVPRDASGFLPEALWVPLGLENVLFFCSLDLFGELPPCVLCFCVFPSFWNSFRFIRIYADFLGFPKTSDSWRDCYAPGTYKLTARLIRYLQVALDWHDTHRSVIRHLATRKCLYRQLTSV